MSVFSVTEMIESEDRAKQQITFAKIRRMEPEVDSLYRLACMIGRKPGKGFCANAVWYNLFKPRLIEMVGFGRHGWTGPGSDLLATSCAYSLAYNRIYKELPGCKGCGCF